MPILTITLRGHLLVAGGQAADLGVDLTTARRFDGHDLVPYIPATALRGAIRIQLEALLRGAGRSAASPYSAPPPEPSPADPVARLFGYSGPLRQRAGAREGALRFGDAMPASAAAARAALAVRPGLEIEDHTASAASGRLFFREVADLAGEPLVFVAPLAIRAPTPAEAEHRSEDLRLLRAAVATTDALGAGKAKGGGAITISWSDDDGAGTTRLTGDPAGAAVARLVFTLREPAHFGDGGPRGNHHATRTHVPGATVRGALAWALLRAGRLTPESAEFRALFLDPAAPVSFGDAILAAAPADTPAIRAATSRHRRGEPAAGEDTLAAELARERVNRALVGRGLYLRADDGDQRYEPERTRPDDGVVRRIRTRVSIDRWQGAAASGRLFSIEQIDPWIFDETTAVAPAGEAPHPASPVRFVSTVAGPSGATPGPLRHLALLAGVPVLVGAGRNHGLGAVDLEIQLAPEPAVAEVLPAERLTALAAAVDRLTASLARRAGVRAADLADGATLPVALLALSDYLPSAGAIEHPLAEPALAELALAAAPVTAGTLADLAPSHLFLNPGAAGGYDQIPGHAPLKDLLPAIGAGSVIVYEVARDRLAAFGALLPTLRRGVGAQVESGCGRWALFAPPAPGAPDPTEDER